MRFQRESLKKCVTINGEDHRNADVRASGEILPTNVRLKLKQCIPFENWQGVRPKASDLCLVNIRIFPLWPGNKTIKTLDLKSVTNGARHINMLWDEINTCKFLWPFGLLQIGLDLLLNPDLFSSSTWLRFSHLSSSLLYPFCRVWVRHMAVLCVSHSLAVSSW